MRKILAKIIKWALYRDILQQDYIMRKDFNAVKDDFAESDRQIKDLTYQVISTNRRFSKLLEHLKISIELTEPKPSQLAIFPLKKTKGSKDCETC